MSYQLTKLVDDLRSLAETQSGYDFEIAASDTSTLINVANTAASKLDKVQRYLPSLNSKLANVLADANVVAHVRAMNRKYTSLAQAVADDELTRRESVGEFRRLRKELVTFANDVELAMLSRGPLRDEGMFSSRGDEDLENEPSDETLYDSPSDALTYDIVKNEQPPPPVAIPAEQQYLQTLTRGAPLKLDSLDDETVSRLDALSRDICRKGIRELIEIVALSKKEAIAVVASEKKIVLKNLADLSKYYNEIRDAQRDIDEAVKIREMVQKSLSDKPRVVKAPDPVPPKASPSTTRRERDGTMSPSQNRERIEKSYQRDVENSEGRHDKHRMSMDKMEHDTIELMKRTNLELRNLPHKLPKGQEWGIAKVPVWIKTSSFITKNNWKNAGVEAIPFDMGWVLENQLVIILPASDVKLQRTHERVSESDKKKLNSDALKKTVRSTLGVKIDSIIDAINNRATDPYFAPMKDRPFTSGGLSGFVYVWLFPRGKYAKLSGIKVLDIGFPRDTGTHEVENMTEALRHSLVKKSSSEEANKSEEKLKVLEEVKTEAEKEIAEDLTKFNNDITKIQEAIRERSVDYDKAKLQKDAISLRINQIHESLTNTTDPKKRQELEIELQRMNHEFDGIINRLKEVGTLRSAVTKLKKDRDALILKARAAAFKRRQANK
jgi:hypothetical protein